ncbi:MAG: CPBP family intramembrane glutamic endopeptidase [Dermatophilaceae bacterium]
MVFVAVAFVLSWLVALPVWLSGGLSNPNVGWVALAMMVTPTVAAVTATFLVLRPTHRARYVGLVPLRPVARLVRFLVIALIGPPLFVFAAVLVAGWFGVAQVDPSLDAFADAIARSDPSGQSALSGLSTSALTLILLATILINSIAGSVSAFGEELGWRGFLLPTLRPLGTWPALVLTGVIWGLWHAPLILLGYNYGRGDVLGLLYMVVLCVLLGALLGWLRMRSASVWPAAVAHGAFNASSPVAFVLVANPSSGISTPVIGWTGWLVLALTIAALAGAGQYHWTTPTVDPDLADA